MADYNWAADSGSSKSSTATPSPIPPGVTQGATADIFDNDLATYQAAVVPDYSSPATAGMLAESDFAAKTINKIVAKYKCNGPVGGMSWSYLVEAYYSSAWHTVGSGSGSTNLGDQTLTYDNLGLTGVTKVKITATTNGFGSLATTGCVIYELQAWGPKYFDIGLRIRTSTATIKIGVLDLEATHKLRIRKGNTTYGIPLLATTDAEASGLRIYDGSAVKALPKVT